MVFLDSGRYKWAVSQVSSTSLLRYGQLPTDRSLVLVWASRPAALRPFHAAVLRKYVPHWRRQAASCKPSGSITSFPSPRSPYFSHTHIAKAGTLQAPKKPRGNFVTISPRCPRCHVSCESSCEQGIVDEGNYHTTAEVSYEYSPSPDI